MAVSLPGSRPRLIAALAIAFIGVNLASAQTYSSSDTTAEISTAALPDAPSAIQAQQQQQSQPQNPSQPQQQPQNPNQPSLSDLGLSAPPPNPALQARLDKHTHMLKIHQTLGLVTLIPMAAAVISSGGATAHHNGSNGTTVTPGPTTSRDVHAALGGLTVGMYAATAYFAIAAPRIPKATSKAASRSTRSSPGSMAPAWCSRPSSASWPTTSSITAKRSTA